jgi:hypothetical protein
LKKEGYLVNTKGNLFVFNENPVVSKGNNAVVSKENNAVVSKGNNVVVSKGNNELYPKDTRNITDNTYNNTKNITEGEMKQPSQAPAVVISKSVEPVVEENGTPSNPYKVDKTWLVERYNELYDCGSGLFRYQNQFYRMN